jgi:hypothetical protein
MTRDEFDGHVRLVFSSASDWRGEDRIWWLHGTEGYYEVTWITGGQCGGNCWGDHAEHAVSGEPEPNMELLDQFLDEVCPNLTARQYRQLLSEIVHRDSYTDYEYYGNYTDRGKKVVWFDKLYQWLCREVWKC